MEMKMQDCSAIELIAAMENSQPIVNDFEYAKSKQEIFAYSSQIDVDRFKDFGTLVYDYMTNCREQPTALYHYTTPNVLRIFMGNGGRIFGTRYDQLNDANEVVLGKEVFFNVLHGRFDIKANVLESLRLKLDALFARGLTPFVFCLSAYGDYLPQWRAYSDAKFGGYSIGFCSGHLVNAVKNIDKSRACNSCYQIWPCFYIGYDDVEYIVENYIRFNLDAFRCLGVSPISNTELENAALKILALLPFIKHHHFKEEREWRIVRTCYLSHPEDERVIGGKLRVPLPLESSLGNIQRLLSEIIVSPHGDSEFLQEYANSIMRENQMVFLAVQKSDVCFR